MFCVLKRGLRLVGLFTTEERVPATRRGQHHLADNVAFGHNFPKHLTEQAIRKILDPTSNDITRVQVILSKLGLSTGKVIVSFRTKQTMEDYTRKYDEDFITFDKQVQKILLKPNRIREQDPIAYSKLGVKVSSLDFAMTEQELMKMAQRFGTIERIDMQIKPSGRNTGKAIVYFNDRQSVKDFVQFANGLEIDDRTLKAMVLKEREADKTKQIKTIEQPKKMMTANHSLYMEHLNKESRKGVD